MPKKSTSIILSAGILAMLALGVTNAKAATIYVPDDYSSIQAAVDAANPGDTIIVRAGTYTENVDVNKSLTIESENGADSTIVQACDPSRFVFEVTGNYVEIGGFTIKPQGTGGIHVFGTHDCTVFNNHVSNYYDVTQYSGECISFEDAQYNTLKNNRLERGHFAIYMVHSSYNTLTNNTTFDHRFAIYVVNSYQNVLAGNTVESAIFEGIVLHGSEHNTLNDNTVFAAYRAVCLASSNYNTLSSNFISGDIGVSLQGGSGNNTLTRNVVWSTPSILLGYSNNNLLYLNNFGTYYWWTDSDNVWQSPEQITYTYKGRANINYLGNYWYDYTGSDADGDGTGDIPYPIDGDSDNYPLMMPFENYEILGEAPPENHPPACVIQLQKDGTEIDKVNVGEFFDIFVGNSTDEVAIGPVRFSSDDVQDGIPTGTWTDWYEWDTSSGDWNAATKTKAWSFATGGHKEVWAEVKDFGGLTDKACANITALWEPFTFVHITDIHIGACGIGAGALGKEFVCATELSCALLSDARDNFVETIREINRCNPKPDFVLVTGDIVQYAEYMDRYFRVSDPGLYMDYIDLLRENLDPSIKVYEVPGNHDRYRVQQCLAYISHDLELYRQYIKQKRPGECKDLIAGRDDYVFEHKGFVFVGLDSGEDVVTPWDLRGSGLSPEQVLALGDPEIVDPSKPKVIFMHHPAMGQADATIRQAEDFVRYCADVSNNVELVLSGHTHEDHVFDLSGERTSPTGCYGRAYPLFIQTPSATLDSDSFLYGYRIIQVKDGLACPLPYIPTRRVSKLVALTGSPVNLHIYDSQGRHTGINEAGGVEQDIIDSFYFARRTVIDNGRTIESLPEKIVVFNPSENYLYQVAGTDVETYELAIGLVQDGDTALVFEATAIPTSAGAVHEYTIDWDSLASGQNGVLLDIDFDGDGIFEKTVISDNELTSDEFALQTETVVDFDPDTLNLKGKGKWVTVYIELPVGHGYDVSIIELASITLNDQIEVEAKPIDIGDYDSDGIPDLMVKFDRQQLSQILKPGEHTVTLTGCLTDGRLFAGTDVVRVIH